MRIPLLSFFFVFSLWAVPAQANTVAVASFKGPQSKQVQASVEKVLRKNGQTVAKASDDELADFVLSGRIRKKGKRFQLTLKLADGDGEPVTSTQLVARKARLLPGRVQKLLWERLGEALEDDDDSGDGFVDEDEDEDEDGFDDEEEEAPEDDSDTDSEDSVVTGNRNDSKRSFEGSVSVGPRIAWRRYSYKDDLFGSLASYEVKGAAAVAFEADFYPTKNIGLLASYTYTPSFNSAINDDASEPLPTTSRQFDVGARLRHQLPAALVFLDLSYGGHNFTLKGAASTRPPIPNVRYRLLRVGTGASMPIPSFPKGTVSAHAGYRHLLKAGQLESPEYFPRLEGAALDGRVAVSVALFERWSVALGLTWERYYFSMQPEVGDPMIAGGAADQYVGAQLLLNARL